MWSCPICNKETVPSVLVPCGHSCCLECAEKCNNCSVCRYPTETIIFSVELCNLLKIDVPKIERPKTHKAIIEDSYSNIKKESQKKINNMIDQILVDIQHIFENDYYEQTFAEKISQFDKKTLETNLDTLLKDHNFDIRIVNAQNGCRIELSQKQTASTSSSNSNNPFSQLFQSLNLSGMT